MVGLGCGARSYTRALHYATEYAVGRSSVRAILADYVCRLSEAFDVADFGAPLDTEEQQRRHVIKSLLRAEGLNLDAYRRRFGSDAIVDLPELELLESRGLALCSPGSLRLTDSGLEMSDWIGPWLYSDTARRQMEDHVLR